MYLAKVDLAIPMPNVNGSLCIRSAPQSGFSLLILRIQSAELAVDPGAATTSARLPPPIGPNAVPMPPDQGFVLDHRNCIQNRGEQSVHQDQPVDV